MITVIPPVDINQVRESYNCQIEMRTRGKIERVDPLVFDDDDLVQEIPSEKFMRDLRKEFIDYRELKWDKQHGREHGIYPNKEYAGEEGMLSLGGKRGVR